jgi:hypothetical protein
MPWVWVLSSVFHSAPVKRRVLVAFSVGVLYWLPKAW